MGYFWTFVAGAITGAVVIYFVVRNNKELAKKKIDKIK